MKLKIAFVTLGLPFSGNSLKKHSLGGSESALLHVARELAKLGQDVTVFCECTEAGVFDNVSYLHYRDMQGYASPGAFDVLIASRFMEYNALPIPTALRVLWLHDILMEKPRVMGTVYQTDLAMVLSKYHLNDYVNQLPELAPILWQTSNGVDLKLIQENNKLPQPNKLIYTSRPERGLYQLLESILPRILEQEPNAVLHIANYDISSLPQEDKSTAMARAIVHACDQLAFQYGPRVVQLGSLSKDKLYQEISSSQAWLYPTSFPEISCIGAMEAQACMTPVITTKGFALEETVGPYSGFLIEGLPQEREYCEKFAEAVVATMREDLFEDAGLDYIKAKGFTWDKIAESWLAKFHELLTERWEGNKEKVHNQLLRYGDLVPAVMIAEEENFQVGDLIEGDIKWLEQVDRQALKIETIRERNKAELRRFKRVINHIRELQLKPASILDVACGDTPFGISAKQFLPETEVSCLDSNKEVCGRINSLVDASGLEVTVYNFDFLEFAANCDSKFDIVFLGNVLDMTTQWKAILEKASKLVSDTGYLALTTRFGPTTAKLSNEYDKLVNFNLQDFNDWFGDDLISSFLPSPSPSEGDGKGHWVVFAKGKALHPLTLDLNRRKLFTRPYESIGFCAITKNEEDNISRCLKAVQPIADSIYIVDSGSTDATTAIAKRFGARIQEVPFQDFSSQRNTSLEMASEDWILWLDADEVLVHPECLRQYLQTKVFEGYIIRQNHLMLDLQGSSDLPVRLFRNKPQYRFTGYVHEHVEDTSKAPFDESIDPACQLSDVEIAHYGYPDEKTRRIKCSSRNMQLLLRDLYEHPDRLLNKLLVQRDLLNIAKWRKGKSVLGMIPGDVEHKLISTSVEVFLTYLTNKKHKYFTAGFSMYQEALMLLGRSGCPLLGRSNPPIQIELLLRGAIGGLSEDNFNGTKIWFVDSDQLETYLFEQGQELTGKLGLQGGETRYNETLLGEIPELLKLGIGVFK
jgi:glycosyltransferase involved in cell wall biosynthesis